MAIDLIRINNTLLSWSSCSFKLDGQGINGISDFAYEQKRERKIVYAAKKNGKPMGRTAGKFSVPSVSMKVLRDTAEFITNYLTLKGLGSYGDAEFTLTAQYIEPVPGSLPIIVVLEGCTIDGEKDGNSEGTDELVTEFEIGCLSISKNGKSLASIVRGLV
ncbi:MAG: hypothetical protein M3Y26_08775 [Actinomycetota bacterium]|nr:hypothetical protein [Actinomycetota bacterium]